MKIIRFNDFWHAVFANFKPKFCLFFSIVLTTKYLMLHGIKMDPKKHCLYTTPFEKNKQSFVFKLAKNCMPNIIKSNNFHNFHNF